MMWFRFNWYNYNDSITIKWNVSDNVYCMLSAIMFSHNDVKKLYEDTRIIALM